MALDRITRKNCAFGVRYVVGLRALADMRAGAARQEAVLQSALGPLRVCTLRSRRSSLLTARVSEIWLRIREKDVASSFGTQAQSTRDYHQTRRAGRRDGLEKSRRQTE